MDIKIRIKIKIKKTELAAKEMPDPELFPSARLSKKLTLSDPTGTEFAVFGRINAWLCDLAGVLLWEGAKPNWAIDDATRTSGKVFADKTHSDGVCGGSS